MFTKNQSGITLVEIIIAVSIFVLIAVIAVSALSSLSSKEVLQKSTDQGVALLEKARALTLSSENNDSYGVHADTQSLTLFSGVTYDENDPLNQEIVLNPRVEISSISLNGAGSDVFFQKLTGKTDTHGDIVLSLLKDGSMTKVIHINETGIIESN